MLYERQEQETRNKETISMQKFFTSSERSQTEQGIIMIVDSWCWL
jgi:hypothetical protein